MENNNKLYSTVAEAAEKMGVSRAYVREILNRGKYDKKIKLRGKKLGREWRIDTRSISEHLGVACNKENLNNAIYIKELETKIEWYKVKINSLKVFIDSLNEIIKD